MSNIPIFPPHKKGLLREQAKQAELTPGQSAPEHLATAGTIERIVFASDDGQYVVAELRQSDGETIVVCGNLGPCSPGEEVELEGTWSQHPKYGKRLQVHSFKSRIPQTLAGLRKFLGSGLITGIGETRARQIVDHFGEETVEVLDQDSERLLSIPGIGPQTVKHAVEAWKRYRGLRELLVFLQGYGVSIARGMQVFKEYGASAVSVLRSNPYRLADDITGIGFKTADVIAQKLGLSCENPERIKAGASYVLRRASERGHTYLPKDVLVSSVRELLSVEESLVLKAIESLCQEKKLAMDPLAEDAVFLTELKVCEESIAESLRSLIAGPAPFDAARALAANAAAEKSDRLVLSDEQASAIRKALTSKVTVITGGPGTGKTALVGRLVRICRRLRVRLALCAPTGRAAKRLSEATDFEAKTVHRLLEYDAFKHAFKYGKRRKLPADFVLMDEASMVDIRLMSKLLSALSPACSLVIVGDADQLPSVGPGAVLDDIIRSRSVPVIRLTHIFRQQSASGYHNLIVVNAHKINQGSAPILPKRPSSALGQFYFVERDSPGSVLKAIIELATNRVPKRFGFDPLTQIQVLTPMHRGPVGTHTLNVELQNALNPNGRPVQFGGRVFRVGDKVMQTKNSYEKDVFNGDIGVILMLNRTNQNLIVDFGDRKVNYSAIDASELELAYAISVHKSQGSEYDAVILPVITQHFLLLQRNLIYTAVTRAKKLVMMVGSKKALFMAIGNDKTSRRYTLLAARLVASRSGPGIEMHP